MTHNDNQDIEQLLAQYGEDRRHQMEAARQVRGLARRRQRNGLTAALVVMLVGVGLAALRMLPTDAASIDSISGPLTASTSPRQYAPSPATPTATRKPAAPPTAVPHRHSPAAPTLPTASPTAEDTPINERPAPLPADECPPSSAAEGAGEPAHRDSRKHRPAGRSHAPGLPSLEGPGVCRTPESTQWARLRLTAQVGATASTSYYERSYLNAGVGLNVALAAASNYEVGIGVGMDGYLHMGSSFPANDNFTHHNSIDDFGYTQSDELEPVESLLWNYPTFALYATLPLTVDLYPGGRERAGLSLSLTPGRAVTPVTNQVGMVTLHGINPWKLTLGVGMTLPKGWLRRVGLTANLLPSYVAGPLEKMHEVGLTLGF